MDSKTAVLYVRVSTEDQNLENQRKALLKFAEGLGYSVWHTYEDTVSGGSANRPSFRRMMNDASKHKFDVILIWSLDRFSREGMLNTLNYLKKLDSYNVNLRSLQESWLDTTQGGVGDLMISIFAWVAEQERKRISERTKAGLARAKNVGKRGKDKKPRKKSGYLLRYQQK